MKSMSDARVQASRAKDAIFEALPGCSPEQYLNLATDYINASEAESSAHVREVAETLNPKTAKAESTLKAATKTLKDEIDEIEAETREVTKVTGAIDALLGAILLFALV
jgi:hypothetical protein